MGKHKISFSGIPWEEPGPGVRYKKVLRGKTQMRVVEFTPEFIEEEWCTRGHVGYVIAGRLNVDFGGLKETFEAGDGVFIPQGPQSKHKASVPEGVARLFLVEDENE